MNDTHYTSRKAKWRRIRAAAAAAAGTAAAMAAFIAGAHGAAAGTPAASQGVIVHSVGGGLARYNAATPHCVVQLPSNAQRCFVHFGDAIAFASGNRVTDAPSNPRAAETNQAFIAEMNRVARETPSQPTGS